ncbi:hypothetical protein [Armatimonas sp.]
MPVVVLVFVVVVVTGVMAMSLFLVRGAPMRAIFTHGATAIDA